MLRRPTRRYLAFDLPEPADTLSADSTIRSIATSSRFVVIVTLAIDQGGDMNHVVLFRNAKSGYCVGIGCLR